MSLLARSAWKPGRNITFGGSHMCLTGHRAYQNETSGTTVEYHPAVGGDLGSL